MAKMIRRKLLLRLAVFLAVSLACCGSSMASIDEIRRNAAETSYGDTTREQVLETRNRRKKQLKVIVMDAQRKLADHSAGVKILTEEEKAQLENNVDLFQRKLESMEVELEEWEIERLVARGIEHANRRRERSQRSRSIKTEL